ncbi:MAG: hypothetical protein QHC90_09320 [Shinella sp.]|nr:hypothetical protein [Shinella sp.]
MTQQFDLFISSEAASPKVTASALKRHSPTVLSENDMVRQLHRRPAGIALELSPNGGKHALATMCIGGGEGIAIALERV